MVGPTSDRNGTAGAKLGGCAKESAWTEDEAEKELRSKATSVFFSDSSPPGSPPGCGATAGEGKRHGRASFGERSAEGMGNHLGSPSRGGEKTPGVVLGRGPIARYEEYCEALEEKQSRLERELKTKEPDEKLNMNKSSLIEIIRA